MNTASGGEASMGGVSRGRPTPRCQAIRLRLDIAVDRVITPEIASALSGGTYDANVSEEITAVCPACDGCAMITLDEANHIEDIEPIEGCPSFRETCPLSIGQAIMDHFQHPV